ncbi:MAG: hypothetical protein JSU86_02730 [Phycisphaerales bacterium]|nr:MAG: hypothetical protein JSU86_02730 [Phycisphaerales bacterium]
MQPIRSGTTTERIVRTTLLVLLTNGFGIAFLWDGYVGYARDNAEQLVGSLGLEPDPFPAITPEVTSAEAHRVIQDVSPGTAAAAVEALLGGPTLEHGDDMYYVGPGGHLRIRLDRGRVAGVKWIDGIHSESELAHQRWIGYGLGALGVLFLLHFIRVVTTRVTLTDEGLKIRGRPLIPFAAMEALRAGGSGKSRRVELGYSLDGRRGLLRLDEYVVRHLPAIVAAICERKAFTNPLKPD